MARELKQNQIVYIFFWPIIIQIYHWQALTTQQYYQIKLFVSIMIFILMTREPYMYYDVDHATRI